MADLHISWYVTFRRVHANILVILHTQGCVCFDLCKHEVHATTVVVMHTIPMKEGVKHVQWLPWSMNPYYAQKVKDEADNMW